MSLVRGAPYEIYRSQNIEEVLTPPKTPPSFQQNELKRMHNWPEPETAPEELHLRKQPRRGIDTKREDVRFNVTHQEVLLLHGAKQQYTHTKEQPIPDLENDREMLVEVEAVGLNPIDWKAPFVLFGDAVVGEADLCKRRDFGWGLPALPCISGRDLAGSLVKTPKASSRFRVGDSVMAISTDYRDNRKAAYQQYAVVSDFNACRLPSHLSSREAAPLGVAFVAAALSLGICIGMDFSVGIRGPRGPDLLRSIRSMPRDALPQDIRAECFDGIKESERAQSGDWIAIWGGSSATGCVAVQLAKLAGFKVIAIIDLARSGERMLRHGADLLVDRHDPERAISVVKGVTKGNLRFGLDTRGKDTAALLAQAMSKKAEGDDGKRAHLVGLVGVPKEPVEGVAFHSVPIKAFHEAPKVGEGLTIWLEKLLAEERLKIPDTEVADGGLEGINAALDRLRDGSVNGPRIVVPLKR